MNKLCILALMMFAALLLASCSAGLTFTSDDNSIGITGYDGNNTIDFSALSGGTGCDQAIGNITAPTGSVGIIACNETITLTSDDASVTIRAWDGNNTIDFAAAGLGGGCADVFRVINPPAGTDPTAQGCNDILNLTASLGNITITGNGITSTVDFTLNPSVTIDAEWNSIAKLEAIYGVDIWNSADGNLDDDDLTDNNLDDLLDVNAGAPANNNCLTWDTGTSRWIPEARVAVEADTLDTVYERGSTVTADVADVLWTLNAVGIDFIINAASTGNFIVQDGGTQRFAVASSGLVDIDLIGSLASAMTVDQTNTSTSTSNFMMDTRMAITSGTLSTSKLWNLCFADVSQNNNYQVSGIPATAEVVGHYYQAKWSGGISDAGSPAALTTQTWAFKGYGEHQQVYDTGTQSNSLTAGGLYLIGYNRAGIWKGGGTDTLYAYGANLDAQMLPYVFSGTANAYTYGVKATAILTPQFSSSINNGYTYGIYCSAQGAAAYAADVAYGIYATAGLPNAADDNWAGYFYRNIADSVPVVMIEQDNTGGLGACLELKQDDTDEPFIDLTGTSSADSSPSFTTRVRVEVNGVDYWWYLDPI